MLRIDVDHPDAGQGLFRAEGQSVRRREGRRGRKRGPTASAIPGGCTSIARPATSGSARTARICGSRSTWSSGAQTTAGASSKGSHPFYPDRKRGPTPIVKPIVEHPHSESRSLTGGVVYHGEKFPDLRGAYIYGDYSHRQDLGHCGTRAARSPGTRSWPAPRCRSPASATDSQGEMLIADHGGGILPPGADAEGK